LLKNSDVVTHDVVKLASDAKLMFIENFFGTRGTVFYKSELFKQHIVEQIKRLEKAGKTAEAKEFKRIYQQLEAISEDAFDTPVTKTGRFGRQQKVGTLTQGDVELNKVMFNYILGASDKAGGVRFDSAQVDEASQFLLNNKVGFGPLKIGNVAIERAGTLQGRFNNVLKADLNYSDFVRVFNQSLENLDPSETTVRAQMEAVLGYLTNPTAIPQGYQGYYLRNAVEMLQKAETLPADRATATKTLRTVLNDFADSSGTDLQAFLG
ncbi:MAG: hypothetical protein ACKO34_08020, partial [Vampirovibrionales bacterium]